MKKILIIENDSDSLDIVTILLEQEYEVVSFTHKITLEKLLHIKPDLLLLDHIIDGSLGGDFCLEIKGNPMTKHIPVIMYSATNCLEEIATNSCADAFIEKPYDIFELENLITEWV